MPVTSPAAFFFLVAKFCDDVVQLVPRNEPASIFQFVLVDGVAQFGRFRVGVVSSVAELTAFGQTLWSSLAATASSIFKGLSRLTRLLEGRHVHYDVPSDKHFRRSLCRRSASRHTDERSVIRFNLRNSPKLSTLGQDSEPGKLRFAKATDSPEIPPSQCPP